MTPRTRTSNRDADYKVYYSKKVPQQVHFPHKRKTVHRPSAPTKDGSDKRQLKFLREKMRIKRVNTVGGSDQDEDEDLEDGGVAIEQVAEEHQEQRTAHLTKIQGKWRRSDLVEAESEVDEKSFGPTPKRRRKAAAPKPIRRSKQIETESERDTAAAVAAEQSVDRSRTLRKQSTMTQFVEGRNTTSDAEEPAFKLVKRSPRLSLSGQTKKGKDKKQRTLTQMIPGMKPLEIVSDEDFEKGLSDAEAQEKDSQAYGEAIVARLAQDGLIQGKSDDVDQADNEARLSGNAPAITNNKEDDQGNLQCRALDSPSVPVRFVENDAGEEDEESYQPTQFINAPITRTKQAPRRSSGMRGNVSQATGTTPTAQVLSYKSRFGLLSTPEKRRIHEIASSQSPPESPFSTQVSPAKTHRSSLKERSDNPTQVAETPSKHEQVTFQEPPKQPIPPPSSRKFRSVIQDSEDEDGDMDMFEANENDSRHYIGARTQALIQGMDNAALGKPVGAETQAILDHIDHVCAHSEENAACCSRESAEEFGEAIFPRGCRGPWPGLGEQGKQTNVAVNEDFQAEHSSYRAAQVAIKQEPANGIEITEVPVVAPCLEEEVLSDMPDDASHESASTSNELPETCTQVPSSAPIVQQPIEDTCPSTPMVIMESSDEEDMDEPKPIPPHQSTHPMPQPSPTVFQQFADLDDEPEQFPRSQFAQHETQQSRSSKAEQQLQNEWFSYSQYVNDHPPQSSGMNVRHGKFSHDATPMPPQSSGMNVRHGKFSHDATPMPPRPTAPLQPIDYNMSQATTVEEVTPRKNRTQRTVSANTTPHRIASSQPFFSPSKPSPLFIPSSFPSPAKARMEEWSSPIFGRMEDTYGLASHGGSLEDFSIPPPPPVDDD